MLVPGAKTRVFLFSQHCDMRKGFDGLITLVRSHMQAPPTSGDYFLFLNARRTMLKVLFWDRHGYAIYHKRLERGTFERPASQPDGCIDHQAYLAMLNGIELKSIKTRKRYEIKA